MVDALENTMAQPAAMTLLGKRKRGSIGDSGSKQQDHNDKADMEGRIVFIRRAATQHITIPPANCPRLPQFLNAIHEQVPAQAIENLVGLPLTPRKVILLQETGAKKRVQDQYTTIDSEDRNGYDSWYIRNVVNGEGTKLRFEIHIFTEAGDGGRSAADFEGDLRQTGTGEEIAPWLVKPYRRISTYIHDMKITRDRRLAVVPLEAIDRKAIEACLNAEDFAEWPATTSWFPARANDSANKNNARKKRAEEGRRKQWHTRTDDEEAEDNTGDHDDARDDFTNGEGTETNMAQGGIDDEGAAESD